MSLAYNAEIYTIINNGRCAAKAIYPIEYPTIYFDYLTLESTKIITVPNNNIEVGDVVRITNQNYKAIYTGFVENIARNENNAEITLKPLQSVLNANTTYLFENQMKEWQDEFDHTASRIAAMLNGMLTPLGHMGGTASGDQDVQIPPYQDVINNAWSYCAYAMQQKGYVVDFVVGSSSYNVGELSIAYQIYKKLKNFIIELDKNYVLDYSINEGSSKLYNTCTIVQVVDGAIVGKEIFYTNATTGEITQDAEEAQKPYIATEVMIDTADAMATLDKAKETISGGKYVNEIRVTINNDNKLIEPLNFINDRANPLDFGIGAVCQLMLGSKSYESILTGYIYEENTTTLIFGCIRQELTKQLAIEKINGGNGTVGGGGGGLVDDVRLNNVSVVENKIAKLNFDYIVESGETAKTNITWKWEKHSNGNVYAWGEATITTGSSPRNRTFELPFTFASDKYELFFGLGHNATIVNGQVGFVNNGGSDDKTASQFSMRVPVSSSSYAVRIYILAIGQWGA